jgi:uncharacterized repeat protein (TIGR03803 family)
LLQSTSRIRRLSLGRFFCGASPAETVLFAFNGADGGSPESNLIFDSGGNLYGMTEFGGNAACTCGVVFKLSQ